MLMACRCLFSTRCLHTWLDPRGISEMFLAPIRNHILLLSSLSPLLRSIRLARTIRRPFRSFVVPSHVVVVAVVAFVVLYRPSLTPTTSRFAFSALFRRAYCRKFVSVPVYLFARVGSRRTCLPTSVCIGCASCVSRESPRERANYNPRWAQLIARPCEHVPLRLQLQP